MAWPRLRLLLRLRRQALLLLLLSVPVSMSHALRCGALRWRVRGVLAGHPPPSSESSCSLADVSEGTRRIADNALGQCCMWSLTETHHANTRPPPPGPIRHNPAGSIRCGPTRPDSVRFGRIRPDPAGFGRVRPHGFSPTRPDSHRCGQSPSDSTGVRPDPARLDPIRSGPIRPGPIRPNSVLKIE